MKLLNMNTKKFFTKSSLTQQNKSVSLSEIIYRSLNSLPLNVSSHQMYDLECSDDDFPVDIVNEYSDKHDVLQHVIDQRDELIDKSNNFKSKKGGMENEPQTSYAQPSQNPDE